MRICLTRFSVSPISLKGTNETRVILCGGPVHAARFCRRDFQAIQGIRRQLGVSQHTGPCTPSVHKPGGRVHLAKSHTPNLPPLFSIVKEVLEPPVSLNTHMIPSSPVSPNQAQKQVLSCVTIQVYVYRLHTDLCKCSSHNGPIIAHKAFSYKNHSAQCQECELMCQCTNRSSLTCNGGNCCSTGKTSIPSF